VECRSPVDFTAKRWGIAGAPPYHPGAKMPSELRDGPVDFTTADMASFQFWREREDCRAAAEALILKHGAAAVRVSTDRCRRGGTGCVGATVSRRCRDFSKARRGLRG
jgi:hypothetical protein